MSYERKSVEVEAIRLVAAIYDRDGGLLANQGEWLIVEGGQQFYMRDVDFHRHFSLKQESRSNIYFYPIYIEKEVYPNRRYWEYPYVWTSSTSYRSAHTNLITDNYDGVESGT